MEVLPDRQPGLTADSNLSTGIDSEGWARELLDSYTSVADLSAAGLLNVDEAQRLSGLGERFRVRVPRYYAALMTREPTCPIRLQALPALSEEDPTLPEWANAWSRQAFGRDVPWLDDAIGDVAKLAAPRLTHRYGNRAIIHLSSLCALYCRFCFRKSHLNDVERTLYDGSLEPALEYAQGTPEIRELILTGGDPLSLPDAWMARFLERLDAIAHLKVVRIHSRMAATLPSRLTDALARTLTAARVHVVLVSHFNHPRELTPTARARLTAFRRAGVPLYNQSVLLRAINDDEATLAELFQGLYELGVTPFYLHQADWTPGTFYFRVPIERGREIMRALRGRVSGPALPDYVLDIPEGAGKISLVSDRVRKLDEHSDGTIGGALYEVFTPQTRQTPTNTERKLYAEFWKI